MLGHELIHTLFNITKLEPVGHLVQVVAVVSQVKHLVKSQSLQTLLSKYFELVHEVHFVLVSSQVLHKESH